MDCSDKFRIECVQNTLVNAIVIVAPGRSGRLTKDVLLMQIDALIEEVSRSNSSAVVVDFSEVGRFDTLMLDAIEALSNKLQIEKGRFVLCNLSEVAQEVLLKTGRETAWPIYPSREAALDAQLLTDAGPELDTWDDAQSFGDPQNASNLFKVLSAGKHAVVGFEEGDLHFEHIGSPCVDQIASLIREYDCREVTFDLCGVSRAPRGFLGLISSILNMGVQLRIANASAQTREMLELSNLDRRVNCTTSPDLN